MHLKLTSILCLAGLSGALSMGCASKPADPNAAAVANDPAVLDINPTPAPAPTPAPVVVTPAPAPTPVVVAETPAASASGSYVVQKGDTLWKIASNEYGDGKQWQKICSANPGLTPETLKAGQTINIP